MKNNIKKVIMALLVLGLIFGFSVNTKISSAYSLLTGYYVAPTETTKIAIKNANSNNKVTVTYSATPNNVGDVAKVQIYKNSGLTGTVVATASFNKAHEHSATFTLPAGKTYYAKVSSASGTSFYGVFKANY